MRTIGTSTFDPSSGLVAHQDGTSVELGGRASDLLELLLKRHGEVISKDEIIETVWSGQIVTEDSLYQSVAEIRRALGPDGKSMLKTLPRRGYRLNLPHDQQWMPVVMASRARLWFGAGLATVVLVVIGVFVWTDLRSGNTSRARPSIAVLPFEAANQEPRWILIGSGLAADIAGTLSRSAWLDTIAPESVKNADGSPSEIAELFDVQYLLSGTIQTEGDVIRISTSLTDHDTNKVLWNFRSTRPAAELFDIEDEIIDKVDGALSSSYGGLIAQHGLNRTRSRPPKSLDAYEEFLLGIEQKHKFTADGYERAVEHLSRAIRLDPGYVLAWSTLSLVRSFQSTLVSEAEAKRLEHLESVAIEKAYSLDPNDPDVLWRMATYTASNLGDRKKARDYQRRAVEAAPNNADVLLIAGWQSPELGLDGPQPFEWTSRAMRLNPRPPAWYLIGHGVAAYASGRYEESIEILASAPPQVESYLYSALAYGKLGDAEGIERELANLFDEAPDFSLERMFGSHDLDVGLVKDIVDTARSIGLPISETDRLASNSGVATSD